MSDYFLVQDGQVAQVAPASVQHFMPQAAVCFLAQQLLHEAQPVNTVAAPTSATHRVRSLMSFIV